MSVDLLESDARGVEGYMEGLFARDYGRIDTTTHVNGVYDTPFYSISSKWPLLVSLCGGVSSTIIPSNHHHLPLPYSHHPAWQISHYIYHLLSTRDTQTRQPPISQALKTRQGYRMNSPQQQSSHSATSLPPAPRPHICAYPPPSPYRHQFPTYDCPPHA